jgi:hypothetical protein
MNFIGGLRAALLGAKSVSEVKGSTRETASGSFIPRVMPVPDEPSALWNP